MRTNSTYKHIDLSYMELMADGDAMMKETMLEMLLEELPGEIKKVEELAVTKDFKQLHAVAHKLKSTLAFVGNPALDQANKDVEKIAKEEMPADDLPKLVAYMVEESALVLEELKAEVANL